MPQPNVIGAGLIDMKHSGLRCRADPVCTMTFMSPSNILVTAAGLLRDAHELEIHTYTHPLPPPPARWTFSATRERRAR